MTVIADLPSANLAIAKAYPALVAALPDAADQQLLDRIVSMVVLPEKLSALFEFGYARADLLPAELKALVADVGSYATLNGFHGLGDDNRGAGMQMVLRGEWTFKEIAPPAPAQAYAVPEPVDDLSLGGFS